MNRRSFLRSVGAAVAVVLAKVGSVGAVETAPAEEGPGALEPPETIEITGTIECIMPGARVYISPTRNNCRGYRWVSYDKGVTWEKHNSLRDVLGDMAEKGYYYSREERDEFVAEVESPEWEDFIYGGRGMNRS